MWVRALWLVPVFLCLWPAIMLLVLRWGSRVLSDVVCPGVTMRAQIGIDGKYVRSPSPVIVFQRTRK